MTDIQQYLDSLTDTASTGDTREESYYSDLSNLLEEHADENGHDDVQVTTLPSPTDGGNPDFRVWSGTNEVTGYIEAKLPSGQPLDTIEEREQLTRYRNTFENVILTNFVEFRLYRNGEQVAEAEIADPAEIPRFGDAPNAVNTDDLETLFEQFFSFSRPEIESARELATELAKRTSFMREVVIQELGREMAGQEGHILGFYEAFQDYLMPDIDRREFADIYSQTITYGMLTARTRVSGEFSRTDAADTIPSTIGILKDIFDFISTSEPPAEIEWIVDDVSDVLSGANVDDILSEFYADRAESTPLVHFYETFLEEYDPETRQQKGVYYTPEPVVEWITQSVNSVLKTDHDRDDGLADEDVTILDPAAGTMTFTAAATRLAVEEYAEKYGRGGVSALLSDHVLDDFYSFELLVAAYTIGHLKMAILFEEQGYELEDDDRVQLYLTNTLEPEEADQTHLPFASSLAEEAEMAHEVKEDTPVLAILGNPPYSGHSENQGEWIESLVNDYKEGYPELQKRGQAKWLHDDYVKFIRWAQWKLSDAAEGTLGYITNHAYIDNPTFMGMREQLLLEFDEIYVLDLHGNSNRLEQPPEGGTDENVFDIQQGVAISIFVKTDNTDDEEYADVYHSDLWGTREKKYETLSGSDMNDIDWKEVTPRDPHYLFVPRDQELADSYHEWVKVPQIFSEYGDPTPGIVTTHNQFAISLTPERQKQKVRQLLETDTENEAREYFNLCSQEQWIYSDAKEHLETANWDDKIVQVQTSPFDKEYTVYDEHVAVHRRAGRLSKHMLAGENISLSVPRRTERTPFDHAFVTDGLMTHHGVSTKEVNYQFPLYLYPNVPDETHSKIRDTARQTNINPSIVSQLSETYGDDVTPEDVFNYTYAVLYTRTYRLKYSEFMETDFPKIPFPEDGSLFRKFASQGKELAQLHILDHPDLGSPGVQLHSEEDGGGENEVSESTGEYYRHYDEEKERLYINSDQYFASVPQDVWEYEIGDRPVVKKWIQNRIGETLSSSDIRKFCRIIRALIETVAIQDELDKSWEGIESHYLTFELEGQQTLDI
ncbi:type ISP restriction/modification enzyme [Halorubrum sp. Atlit-26R]|uniref:type ISP restriction/modification enzyme n=1 Tax=Halorubrum sp. Atlit-26R TaxID=2282128 RepID=UPI001F3E0946|nr:type ISP restriction/modification enzyme [Halorubrum sp. Atlit-26R]